MLLSRRSAVSTLSVAALASLAACGSDAGGSSSDSSSSGSSAAAGGGDLKGSIKGAGSTAQADAQTVWMNALMDANADASVEYGGGGSGAGVKKFIQKAVDYAGSDSYLKDDDLKNAGDVVEVPLYISPIAVAYNVPGFTGDKHINMTGEVIAKIFHGDITTWDDDAIKSLNPDASLPSTEIVTVHRSDESGTTENFTKYLADVAKDVWTDDPSKTWPISGGQSGDGTSGVITTIEAAEGTIGYADASKVTDKLGTAAVGKEGAFVAYSADAAAKTLDASKESDSATDTLITFDINHEAEDSYPILLVSYMIARQKYDDADVTATVKGYFEYAASKEGQEAAAKAAGSAPISDDLRTKIEAAIAKIGA